VLGFACELVTVLYKTGMASVKETGSFFTHGDSKQYEFVLTLYPQALKLKAKEKKLKKPEDLLKLDAW
jgi:hypothetical protein